MVGSPPSETSIQSLRVNLVSCFSSHPDVAFPFKDYMLQVLTPSEVRETIAQLSTFSVVLLTPLEQFVFWDKAKSYLLIRH